MAGDRLPIFVTGITDGIHAVEEHVRLSEREKTIKQWIPGINPWLRRMLNHSAAGWPAVPLRRV
ncbi:hypothetical protein KAM622c_11370 [Klebsiella quasipneumoniae subsp. quasipneumoniae]|nr:hypothetical protein KAM622c_11370 [Klebsiella quasipneumoniae subsp. quasipneumoniae]